MLCILNLFSILQAALFPVNSTRLIKDMIAKGYLSKLNLSNNESK